MDYSMTTYGTPNTSIMACWIHDVYRLGTTFASYKLYDLAQHIDFLSELVREE